MGHEPLPEQEYHTESDVYFLGGDFLVVQA